MGDRSSVLHNYQFQYLRPVEGSELLLYQGWVSFGACGWFLFVLTYRP